MGFLPAQRLSASQRATSRCARGPLAETSNGSGSQPRAPPLSTFLRSSGVVPTCLATILRPLPLTGFSLQSFAPQTTRRTARAADALLDVTPVAERPPSRGSGVTQSRTTTTPYCRGREARCSPGCSLASAVTRADATLGPACADPPWTAATQTRALPEGNVRGTPPPLARRRRSRAGPCMLEASLHCEATLLGGLRPWPGQRRSARRHCLPWGYLLLEALGPASQPSPRSSCSGLSGYRSPLGVSTPTGSSTLTLPSPCPPCGVPDEARSLELQLPFGDLYQDRLSNPPDQLAALRVPPSRFPSRSALSARRIGIPSQTGRPPLSVFLRPPGASSSSHPASSKPLPALRCSRSAGFYLQSLSPPEQPALARREASPARPFGTHPCHQHAGFEWTVALQGVSRTEVSVA